MNAAIYLDWNATAPVWPEVVAEMAETVRHAWANPSSMHAPGQAARRVLVDARARVASFLGASPAELVFTSGATESNHAAVRGVLAAARGTRRQRNEKEAGQQRTRPGRQSPCHQHFPLETPVTPGPPTRRRSSPSPTR